VADIIHFPPPSNNSDDPEKLFASTLEMGCNSFSRPGGGRVFLFVEAFSGVQFFRRKGGKQFSRAGRGKVTEKPNKEGYFL